MKIRIASLGLLALLWLGGCATSSDLPTTNDLLLGAHASLEQGDLETARVWLGSARSSLETDEDHKQFALLASEVDLRAGQAEVARQSMDQLLESYPVDPRVHEMAGKSRLHLGEFHEASSHFDVAVRRYEDEDDIRRASDLFALARGLEAYAEGHVVAAQDHWASISDRDLRASVMESSGAVPPPNDRQSSVLVKTYEPTP
jgi:uncharacterized protein HemY